MPLPGCRASASKSLARRAQERADQQVIRQLVQEGERADQRAARAQAANRTPLLAGGIEHPSGLGAANSTRGAACRAPLIQVIHAGDTDIGGCRGVDARARRPDQREPHCGGAAAGPSPARRLRPRTRARHARMRRRAPVRPLPDSADSSRTRSPPHTSRRASAALARR